MVVSASTPQGTQGADEGIEILRRSYRAMKEGSWDLDTPHEKLERFCWANGIPFLSLELRFRQIVQAEGTALHWTLDSHWDVEGNDRATRLMTELAEQVIIEGGSISRPPPLRQENPGYARPRSDDRTD